ncbi:RNA polymerase II-associated factor 1 homolog isoform X2 [Drosophila ficusphila]|uniref:RNA polymerase II-associated factor 1 homolog isoform X2 n=1 Tax=Drosophila ficusphila TaxID=30025 RepID=UPI0007E8A2AB|nr:RNA polymerase II-associated factor 1 homolog isoform X2 [Drosophila ficusphila]
MAANELDKPRKQNPKNNQFICPIVFKNEVPPPAVDCKFLPCGKDIVEFTVQPVLYPQQESHFLHHFRGLHQLFDLDFVNLSVYDKPKKNVQKMGTREAALLSDIEALSLDFSRPRPSRAQECAQMFAKERVQVPRLRPGLQRPPAEAEAEVSSGLEAISLEEQKAMIDKTFEEVQRPLLVHPTKPNSKARPLEVFPIFPDPELQSLSFVQMQFDIPPNDYSRNLIKDCGHNLVNFKPTEELASEGSQIYLSDQRFKEEKPAENAERGERFIFNVKSDGIYYVSVDKHIKLRRERPRPEALANKCLLQVKRVAMETK